MRVAHFVTGRVNPNGTNGGDRVAYHLVRTFEAAGHEMFVIGSSDRPPLPIGRANVSYSLPPRNPFTLGRRLKGALLELRPDIMHIHGVYVPRNALLGRWLRRHGIAYAVSPHGGLMPGVLTRDRAKKLAFIWLADRCLLARASFIHVISEAEARAVRRFAPQTPVVVAPHGLEGISPDTIDADYLRRSFQIPQGKRIIGFLGRLDPLNKGLDLLVEACALVRDDLRGAAVVLAGPDWHGRTHALRQQVKRLGLSDTVIFLGPIPTGPEAMPEKFDFLASCDVFVHLSRWEAGIPFSVLDAMEVGKPCLVTNLDFWGDFFRRHRAGRQVPPTVQGAAEGLSYFCRASEEELRTIGSEARRSALSEFSWEKTAGRIGRAYAEACADVHPRPAHAEEGPPGQPQRAD